jgi:predicted permease
MPKGYAYPDEKTMALVPMRIDYSTGYGAFGIEGIARLKPGVTLVAAQAEVDALQSRIQEIDKGNMPAAFLKQAGWKANAVLLRDRVVKDAEKTLLIVLVTVGFLLVVACASVANLFLVRAEGRRREVGVRFALGATRGRVASTFVAESLILGVAGGAWGMVIAFVALRSLIAAAPPELPRLNEIGIDSHVILFAAIISIVAGILFGVLPLPHRMQRPLADLVRGGRGQTDNRDRQALRKTLIVAQIALALMLLVGSGLMLRSFDRLRHVDSGVNPEGVLTMGVSIGEVKDRAAAAALYGRIVTRVAALPGVTVAGASNALPIDPSGLNGGSFEIKSAPRAEGALPPVAMFSAITGNFFKAMGTPIVEGRDVDNSDVDHARPVAVVNQTFARDLMKGKAIGQQINFSGDDSLWITIIGVVKDTKTFGLREAVKPMAYMPLSIPLPTVGLGQVSLVVKTNGDPAQLAPSVRSAVHSVAPDMPVTTARTMDEVVATSTAQTSLTMTILALAAGVAMLLGAIGLYGVIGYVVTQRTKEIGVRIALGAMPGTVGAMVLRQGMRLAVAGIITGMVGAVALSHLMESILFEVNSRDPLTFVVVPIILLGVTAVAAWLPARRAAAVSPMEALSSD